MDDHRFDGLTRALGGSGSRRLASGLIAGSTALALRAWGQPDVAEAKKKRKKKKKKKCPAPPLQTCAAGQILINGQCVTGLGTCAAGTTSCGAAIGQQTRCNNAQGCACYRSASGDTRCGKLLIDGQRLCGQCTTDAQCSGFGVGAFCVLATNNEGKNCSCGTIGQGFCMLPC